MEAEQLKQRLQETMPTAERIRVLTKLGELYLVADLPQSELYAAQLLAIALEHADDEAYLQHYLLLGRIHYRKANLALSLEHFEKADEYALQMGHAVAHANILESKGMLLNQHGHNEEALVHLHAALQVYQEKKVNPTLLGMCYNNLACTYDTLKQHDKAEEYYKLALQSLEKATGNTPIKYINANLGLLLLNQNKYAEALARFEDSMNAFKAHNQIQAQGLAYHYIAQCYMGLGAFDTAQQMYEKGLQLLKNNRFYHELSVLYMGLGTLYHELGGYAKAEVHFNKALEMRLQRQYWHGACEAYVALIKLYRTMGDDFMANDKIAQGAALAKRERLVSWESKFAEMA